MLAAALGLACVLGGCASNAPTIRGQVRGQDFQPAELLQSEGNRIAQNAMLANHRSLMALADIERSLVSTQPWPPLGGRRDVTALSHALAPDFAGDRVAAFIVACADTIVTAHGGKREFYYLDGIDPQHLYNAARNMEIALWILNTRRDAQGQPLLLANEIGPDSRNLSFEREFGKIIGRLDLLASYATERYRRAVIGYVQGVVAAPLLAFLPVK